MRSRASTSGIAELGLVHDPARTPRTAAAATPRTSSGWTAGTCGRPTATRRSATGRRGTAPRTSCGAGSIRMRRNELGAAAASTTSATTPTTTWPVSAREQGAERRRRRRPTMTTNSPGRIGTRACSSSVDQRAPLVELVDHLAGEPGQVLDDRALLGDAPRGRRPARRRAGRGCRPAAPRGRRPGRARRRRAAARPRPTSDHGDELGQVHLAQPLPLGDARPGRAPSRPGGRRMRRRRLGRPGGGALNAVRRDLDARAR